MHNEIVYLENILISSIGCILRNIRWDIHHDFGSFVTSNLSKMLKFAATHREMTNKTKHQLISKTFVHNINEGKEMR